MPRAFDDQIVMRQKAENTSLALLRREKAWTTCKASVIHLSSLSETSMIH
jgi:hypothetical protein